MDGNLEGVVANNYLEETEHISKELLQLVLNSATHESTIIAEVLITIVISVQFILDKLKVTFDFAR